jgi:hypothetical protein
MADCGLAYMALLADAQRKNIDLNAKDAKRLYAAQQFFMADGQNWCGSTGPSNCACRCRPIRIRRTSFASLACAEHAGIRQGVRMQGGQPMMPANACRVMVTRRYMIWRSMRRGPRRRCVRRWPRPRWATTFTAKTPPSTCWSARGGDLWARGGAVCAHGNHGQPDCHPPAHAAGAGSDRESRAHILDWEMATTAVFSGCLVRAVPPSAAF